MTTINTEALLNAAREVRLRAYVPYSGYRVGAALLTEDGTIHTGCNVENASFPAAICAERVAITRAVADGAQGFMALAVVTENGGAPCGICRQVMAEFSLDMRVILADETGATAEYTVRDLLPDSFGPKDLT